MDRRKLLTGLVSLIAAPAIVRVGSLMPVSTRAGAPTSSMVLGDADLTWARMTIYHGSKILTNELYVEHKDICWTDGHSMLSTVQ